MWIERRFDCGSCALDQDLLCDQQVLSDLSHRPSAGSWLVKLGHVLDVVQQLEERLPRLAQPAQELGTICRRQVALC